MPYPFLTAIESEAQHEITVVAVPGTDGIGVAKVDVYDFKAAVLSGKENVIIVKVQSSPDVNAIKVEIPATAMAELEG